MTFDEAMAYIRKNPKRTVVRATTGMRVAWRFGREVVLTAGRGFIDYTPTDVDMAAVDWRPSITDLIEASSFGTPEAKVLRESVSDEDARRVVARAKQIGEA